MTALQAAGFYAAIHFILFFIISFNVSRLRRRHKVSLGDGGNELLLRAGRAHGNYVEYTPMILIGLFLLAVLGGSVWLIHALGAAYTIARVFHFLELGLGSNIGGRFIGALTTYIIILVTGLALFYQTFMGGA